jgi:GTP-binding protein
VPGDFVDETTIWVKAGDGGNGARSFRHEKYVALGGPDGGDGGRGGDVTVRANASLRELSDVAKHRRFSADRGGDGGSSRKHGKRGSDLAIGVPVGTVVWFEDQILADLVRPGQEAVVARAGKGGLGNVHFATAVRQAPRFAQNGEPGEERSLRLDLRTIGDVGFVGEPNAGKSSILAAMTAAHPEIAAYPFTTLTPNLGVATIDDTSFVAVDIPGLIEGAHEGAGLGHRFLRHVQRAGLLVHVLDISADDPWGAYERVRVEMEQFDPELVERASLVALNKIDAPNIKSKLTSLSRRFRTEGIEAVPVSALTGEGIPRLTQAIAARIVTQRADRMAEEAPIRTYRMEPEGRHVEIRRDHGGYRVSGRQAERTVAMADMETADGLAYLQRELERTGVFKALRDAGVKEGDTVWIGDFEMEWT